MRQYHVIDEDDDQPEPTYDGTDASHQRAEKRKQLIHERRMHVLHMRAQGKTYNAISKRVGVSQPVVQRDMTIATREVMRESAEEMLAKQKSLLFDLVRNHYDSAMRGNPDSFKVIKFAMEHEAKLFGLIAPTRLNIGIPDEDFATTMAKMMLEIGVKPPPELAAPEPDYAEPSREQPVIIDQDDGWVQG